MKMMESVSDGLNEKTLFDLFEIESFHLIV